MAIRNQPTQNTAKILPLDDTLGYERCVFIFSEHFEMRLYVFKVIFKYFMKFTNQKMLAIEHCFCVKTLALILITNRS